MSCGEDEAMMPSGERQAERLVMDAETSRGRSPALPMKFSNGIRVYRLWRWSEFEPGGCIWPIGW